MPELKIQPVILSGGSGSRLWPASRAMYPKQLLPLVSRLDGLTDLATGCIVICNDAHRFLVAEQLRELDVPATIVLEPEGRNTAPAVALAAFIAIADDPDAMLLVMPADHVIRDREAFQAAVRRGLDAAADEKLVTFGVVPKTPETGYGYIQAAADGDLPVPIAAFVEKPDKDTAIAYLQGGQHFWNSGMFLFTAKAFLDAVQKFEPDIYSACQASIENRMDGEDFVRPDPDAFLRSPSNSIDYAVMEKTDKAVMVPLDAGWSDVGSWSALQEVRDRDIDGNTVDGDVLMLDCKNSFVQAESRLVAAVGLEDMVVIETRDSTLVARKDRSQDVKKLVDQLNTDGREETRFHRQVFRPWGSYDSLENKPGFQVKRLIVNAGAVLSLQKHAHRAEHWVVVQGRVRITRNDEIFDLIHRIANPYEEPAHIIEVQCGDYLGEDDIVRIEDEYGREGTNS
jgi:mannose-1-phosphate guanylyltransferase/mannose-6-phosphate isomerase